MITSTITKATPAAKSPLDKYPYIGRTKLGTEVYVLFTLYATGMCLYRGPDVASTSVTPDRIKPGYWCDTWAEWDFVNVPDVNISFKSQNVEV